MDDRRTPMEAEVQELPARRAPNVPEDFYGTAAKPAPRRTHAFFWILVGVAVLALCTSSVVAAFLHVRLTNGDGGWRLSMKPSAEVTATENPVKDLQAAQGGDYTPSGNQTGSSVHLQTQEQNGTQLSTEELYARVSPAVVCVQVETYYGTVYATGVVISSDGYLLSATEGLTNAVSLTVSFPDGTVSSARRVGEDRLSGICLLKAEAKDLPTVSFSKGEAENVGAEAFCICNPYGPQLPNLFYDGMLSACRKLSLGGREYTVLQASAQLQNLGYGCPILDSQGRVLGLTAPIGQRLSSGSGDPSLAVSAADLEGILASFAQDSSGGSLWLGLEVEDIPEEYQRIFGFPGSLWIGEVAVGSAPYGVLYQHDIITAVDDVDISSAADYHRLIGEHQAGDQVRLTIFRSGKWYTIQLPVLER